MATSTAPTLDVLTDVVRDRARAEAREVVALVEFRSGEIRRTEHVEPAMRRQVERSAIPLRISEATQLTERQVQLRLSCADTLMEKAPLTWAAFRDGLIDFARAREIAATINRLQRAESIRRLDQLVLGFATDHTSTELSALLRRFVTRVEPDLAAERADKARTTRHVSVTHGADSMSWLRARLPSHEAAAIVARVGKQARKSGDPDDERTIPQREADLLVAWCLGSESATGAVDANIAVMIPADVLAGAFAGFAESADGLWAVPAGWISEVTQNGNTFWNRMVLSPVTGDVLSHEYLGRFAPDTLAVALRFLHGVCQAPGCMMPADRCDLDHREPWPEGSTTAANLGPLCRRHHAMKGHGFLHWSTTRPRPPSPATVLEIYATPVDIEYAA